MAGRSGAAWPWRELAERATPLRGAGSVGKAVEVFGRRSGVEVRAVAGRPGHHALVVGQGERAVVLVLDSVPPRLALDPAATDALARVLRGETDAWAGSGLGCLVAVVAQGGPVRTLFVDLHQQLRCLVVRCRSRRVQVWRWHAGEYRWAASSAEFVLPPTGRAREDARRPIDGVALVQDRLLWWEQSDGEDESVTDVFCQPLALAADDGLQLDPQVRELKIVAMESLTRVVATRAGAWLLQDGRRLYYWSAESGRLRRVPTPAQELGTADAGGSGSPSGGGGGDGEGSSGDDDDVGVPYAALSVHSVTRELVVLSDRGHVYFGRSDGQLCPLTSLALVDTSPRLRLVAQQGGERVSMFAHRHVVGVAQGSSCHIFSAMTGGLLATSALPAPSDEGEIETHHGAGGSVTFRSRAGVWVIVAPRVNEEAARTTNVSAPAVLQRIQVQQIRQREQEMQHQEQQQRLQEQRKSQQLDETATVHTRAHSESFAMSAARRTLPFVLPEPVAEPKRKGSKMTPQELALLDAVTVGKLIAAGAISQHYGAARLHTRYLLEAFAIARTESGAQQLATTLLPQLASPALLLLHHGSTSYLNFVRPFLEEHLALRGVATAATAAEATGTATRRRSSTTERRLARIEQEERGDDQARQGFLKYTALNQEIDKHLVECLAHAQQQERTHEDADGGGGEDGAVGRLAPFALEPGKPTAAMLELREPAQLLAYLEESLGLDKLSDFVARRGPMPSVHPSLLAQEGADEYLPALVTASSGPPASRLHIFEALCRIYFLERPELLPGFVHVVSINAAPDGSGHDPRILYHQRALAHLPVVTEASDQGRKDAFVQLLCNAEQPAEAVRFLLRIGDWERARALVERRTDQDVEHFQLFHILLSHCLQQQRFDGLWELMPHSYSVLDLLAQLRRSGVAGDSMVAGEGELAMGQLKKQLLVMVARRRVGRFGRT